MKLDIKDLDKLQDGLQDLVQKGVQKGVDGLNKGIDYINNIDGSGNSNNENAAAKEGVPAVCKQCGAKLNINSNSDVVVCEYCGATYDNKKSPDAVSSILEFVEKQQSIHEQKIERDRLDKEERLLKKLEREKKKRRRSLIRLPFVLVTLLIIYYMITSSGYAISDIPNLIQSLFLITL